MTTEQLLQGGIEAIQLLGNRIVELEAVLKPFAQQAEIIDSQRDDPEDDFRWESSQWFRFGGSITAITLGDCRRAAAVLAAGRAPVTPSTSPPNQP